MTPAQFLATIFALQAFDAFSTAKGLRNGAVEANGFLRRLMAAIGVNEALFLVKLAALVWLWFHPPASAIEQWLLIGVYAFGAVWNLRILRKLGVV